MFATLAKLLPFDATCTAGIMIVYCGFGLGFGFGSCFKTLTTPEMHCQEYKLSKYDHGLNTQIKNFLVCVCSLLSMHVFFTWSPKVLNII